MKSQLIQFDYPLGQVMNLSVITTSDVLNPLLKAGSILIGAEKIFGTEELDPEVIKECALVLIQSVRSYVMQAADCVEQAEMSYAEQVGRGLPNYRDDFVHAAK